MGLSVLSECIGMAGPQLGGDRCNYGPFGKTDRAIAFSLVSLWLSLAGSFPPCMHEILLGFIALHGITIFNRTVYLLSLIPTATQFPPRKRHKRLLLRHYETWCGDH
jgi:hypothetical protein